MVRPGSQMVRFGSALPNHNSSPANLFPPPKLLTACPAIGVKDLRALSAPTSRKALVAIGLPHSVGNEPPDFSKNPKCCEGHCSAKARA